MSEGVISTDQNKIRQRLIYRDGKGRPGAVVYGVPTVALDRSDLVTAGAVDMTDPKNPFVEYTLIEDAPVGRVHTTVIAEGEETPGEQQIIIEGDINVIAADAESGDSSFDPAT